MRSGRMSFAVHLHTTGFCFSLLYLVFFHTPKEIISTFGMFDMFNSEIDSFRDDSVSQLLVDNNSHSSSSHIENSTCFAMVILVRHSLMDCSITLDIYNITNFVGLQVSREVLDPCFPEFLGEKISGPSTLAMWVSHCR